MAKSSSRTPRKRRRLTPKQRVLKEYPEASAVSYANEWVVYRPYWSGNTAMGNGKTAALAWADAARNL